MGGKWRSEKLEWYENHKNSSRVFNLVGSLDGSYSQNYAHKKLNYRITRFITLCDARRKCIGGLIISKSFQENT